MGNDLLTDDDLMAAFAEIEGDENDSIPDLGDGKPSEQTSGIVTVTGGIEPEFDATPADEADASPEEESSSAVEDNLVMDEFASPEAVAALASKDEDGGAEQQARKIDFKAIIGRVHDRTYDAIDYSLNVVNRPFANLDTQARGILTLCSLVTLGLSLLVIVLAPLMIRGKTATEFLQEKAASVRHVAASESESSE